MIIGGFEKTSLLDYPSRIAAVVFTCGCVFDGETVSIYYGAADDKICRGDISLKDLFTHLGV